MELSERIERLNKEDVCVLVMEQWNRIAEWITKHGAPAHPETLKRAVAQDLGFGHFAACCAACEYDARKGKGDCSKCPVWGHLNHDCDGDPMKAEWSDYMDNPTPDTALAIAYRAEEALDRLEGLPEPFPTEWTFIDHIINFVDTRFQKYFLIVVLCVAFGYAWAHMANN